MTIPAPAAPRSAAAAALAAFGALLARDLTALRWQPADFLTRAIVQPVLFVFVLGYVSRRIGQPAAGSATQTATTLLAGMLAIVILFRGPVRRDPAPGAGSRLHREIDDRLLAPLPAWAVALEKIALGTIQGLLAALVIFPLAIVIPAAPPAFSSSTPSWPPPPPSRSPAPEDEPSRVSCILPLGRMARSCRSGTTRTPRPRQSGGARARW